MSLQTQQRNPREDAQPCTKAWGKTFLVLWLQFGWQMCKCAWARLWHSSHPMTHLCHRVFRLTDLSQCSWATHLRQDIAKQCFHDSACGLGINIGCVEALVRLHAWSACMTIWFSSSMNTQAHCFLSFIAKSCQFNHAWPHIGHRARSHSLLPRLRTCRRTTWPAQRTGKRAGSAFPHCEWVPSHFCLADTSYMDTPVQVIACSVAPVLTQAYSSHVISILCKLPRYSVMWSWDSPRICTWIHGQCPALLWQRPPKPTYQQSNYNTFVKVLR